MWTRIDLMPVRTRPTFFETLPCYRSRVEQAETEWLTLGYSLPAEPSRYRVSIWRRLRKLGAIYMNEGFWVIPNSDLVSEDIAAVIREVETYRGTASAFVSRDLNPMQGQRLRRLFLDARNEEYSELHGQYEKFVLHVDHARATKRLTFAEVEELEEEMSKLERWFNEIKDRDIFHSPARDAALQALEQGRSLLQGFTDETYAAIEATQKAVEAPDIR